LRGRGRELTTVAEHSVVGDIRSEESISGDVIEFEASRASKSGGSGVGASGSGVVALTDEEISRRSVGQIGAIAVVNGDAVVERVSDVECGSYRVERHS